MWRFKPMDDFLGPLFLGMQTLPSVCWVPLGIAAFGLTDQGIEFVLVMGSFFAIAISMRDGLRTIPPLYQRAGLMLGAGGWKLYRNVLIPASMPAIASGLPARLRLRLAIADGSGICFRRGKARPGLPAQTGTGFNQPRAGDRYDGRHGDAGNARRPTGLRPIGAPDLPPIWIKPIKIKKPRRENKSAARPNNFKRRTGVSPTAKFQKSTGRTPALQALNASSSTTNRSWSGFR